MGIFMKNKQLLTLVSLLGVVLFSCKKTTSATSAFCSCPSTTPSVTSTSVSTSPVSDSSGTPSASASASASASTSTSTSEAKASDLVLTLTKSALKTGNNFLDSAKPGLDYLLGETHFIPMEDPSHLSWLIEDSHETMVSADTALTAGTYTVTALYNGIRSNTLTFTVSDWDSVDTTKGVSHPVTDFGSMTLEKTHSLSGFSHVFPSSGTPKMLIVPVDFSDDVGTTAEWDNITKLYSGTDGETGWKSVHDYYYEPSYHKLDISVSITPWFRYGRTTENQDGKKASDLEAATDTTTSGFDPTWDIVKNLKDWLVAQNYSLTDYDYDKDGYVDGIEMIYKYSGKNVVDGGSSLWWNYTYVYYPNENAGTVASPAVYPYCWFLYSSVQSGYYTPDIDAHTVVHETGHLMGLDDYYDTSSACAPCGYVDMMDANVGDHDAYSKMAFNWITPDVLDGTGSHFTYTLKPFEEDGSCLLVRNTSTDAWNQNPFDEYLLLQYYTPTGLNAKDTDGYGDWKKYPFYGRGGTYASAGLKVFHIDSRMFTGEGTQDDDGNILTKTFEYTDTYRSGGMDTSVSPHTFEYGCYLSASNTPTKSYNIDRAMMSGVLKQDSPYRLIQMITPYSENLTARRDDFFGMMGAQANLFEPKVGQDYFSFSHQEAYFPNQTLFNDYSALGYSFKVTGMDTAGLTLEFFAD
jgi:M6 family metalloprotease-like protein